MLQVTMQLSSGLIDVRIEFFENGGGETCSSAVSFLQGFL